MNRLRSLLASVLVLTPLALSAPAEAAAPNTIIKSGPTGTITSTTATFTFKAKPKQGATFQCRMDAGRFTKCTSPATYRGLTQGAHTFSVRAKRDGKKDRTPATRAFSIDSVGPAASITAGPDPVTADHTPSFTFSSSEAGATLQCRLGAAAFASCSSPYTLPETPDGVYSFQVRARDALGNTGATPVSWGFEILTPLVKDLATAHAAAAFYFPDSADVDVPASCGGDITVDCPGGEPLPPADQLRVVSSRSVVEVAGQDRYDLTVTADVSTLAPFVFTYSGTTCEVTLTSANGPTPTWQVLVPLNFVHPPGSDEWRVSPGQVALNGVESADISISSTPFACSLFGLGIGFFIDTLVDAITDQLVGGPLCAARGPDYLGYCTS